MSEHNPDFSPEERELMNAVQCGLEAEAFLKSDFGRDLMKRVDADHRCALEKLVEADPEDSRLIRKLQDDVKIPLRALNYIQEIISFGQYADDTLNPKE
jgi:hypothetical protein